MRENDENLLAVAWWVILNSPDWLHFLLKYTSCRKSKSNWACLLGKVVETETTRLGYS